MKERKARVEDALSATRAAVEEGIIPGGGVAFLKCLDVVDKLKTSASDEKTGAKIIQRVLEVPVRQLAENSGFDGAVIAQKIKESKDTSFGFNAEKDEFEDLVKAGIVEPTKVVRDAIENAESIAALLLTTESLVIEIPEKKYKTMAPPPYPEY